MSPGILPIFASAVGLAWLHFRLDDRRIRIATEAVFWYAMSVCFVMVLIPVEFKAIASAWPLQDSLMLHLDRSVGFDWLAWYTFVQNQPWLRETLSLAYQSYMVQPVIAITVLAIWRPWRGNFELFFLMSLSAVIVIAVAHFVPTTGPADFLGLPSTVGKTIMSLREGVPIQNPDPAAIAFPSLHTVSAIVYTYGVRRTPIFMPIAGLNLLMLVAIPSDGDHYVVDMFGGAVVALAAIWSLTLLRQVEMRPWSKWIGTEAAT